MIERTVTRTDGRSTRPPACVMMLPVVSHCRWRFQMPYYAAAAAAAAAGSPQYRCIYPAVQFVAEPPPPQQQVQVQPAPPGGGEAHYSYAMLPQSYAATAPGQPECGGGAAYPGGAAIVYYPAAAAAAAAAAAGGLCNGAVAAPGGVYRAARQPAPAPYVLPFAGAAASYVGLRAAPQTYVGPGAGYGSPVLRPPHNPVSHRPATSPLHYQPGAVSMVTPAPPAPPQQVKVVSVVGDDGFGGVGGVTAVQKVPLIRPAPYGMSTYAVATPPSEWPKYHCPRQRIAVGRPLGVFDLSVIIFVLDLF